MNHLTPWLAGGSILVILAALWTRLRTWLSHLLSLGIVKVQVHSDLASALESYCWKNFSRSPFGEKRFSSFLGFIRPLDRYQAVGYESVGHAPIIFWKGWKPFIMSLSQMVQGDARQGYILTATFIRGTFDIEKIIIEALDEFNQQKHGGNKGERYKVERFFGKGRSSQIMYGSGKEADENKPSIASEYNPNSRILKWDRSDIGEKKDSIDPFSVLAFPENVLEAVNQIKRWLNSENWYKSKSIPWKYGALFHGAPGGGKSSIVSAIAKELDLPIIAFDLASFSNQDFTRKWDSLLNQTPCIALFEDIDAVFNGRENKLGEEGGGLTFDCFLNCISGVRNSSGVLTIVTTNRIECLDEALGKPDGERGISTRPGRIDIVIELPRLDDFCRRKIAERILVDCDWEIERIIEEGEGDSGAQFTDRCSKLALEYYWNRMDRNGHLVESKENL